MVINHGHGHWPRPCLLIKAIVIEHNNGYRSNHGHGCWPQPWLLITTMVIGHDHGYQSWPWSLTTTCMVIDRGHGHWPWPCYWSDHGNGRWPQPWLSITAMVVDHGHGNWSQPRGDWLQLHGGENSGVAEPGPTRAWARASLDQIHYYSWLDLMW